MSKQIINIGSAPNDGTGDQLRVSFDKCNLNFTELYDGLTLSLPIGNAIEYQFSNLIIEPPASGQIRFDQTTQALTTKLWASHTTSSGINIKQFLSAATTGAKLILQDKNDNTNFIKFDVISAPVDKTTYWEFQVSSTAAGGNLPNAAILASVTAPSGGGGGGNVSSSGTPASGQYAQWTGPATIQGVAAGALTAVNDTNITLTLGGTPATALLQATSITVGWTGTLPAARLNANVVQAVTNDTNVTGSISAQTLTLGWTGTLANARLANMAAHTYKGNNTGVTATPIDVTNTQLTADLNLFTSTLQGLVPASGGGTVNFLRADGAFAAPPGGGGGAGGGPLAIRIFTSSGTYTPTVGMATCIVECVGGGGGGNGTAGATSQSYVGGGGGSGAYARKYLTAAQVGASQTITIGAAGTGGVTGGNVGGVGGDTSFGSLCIAKGATQAAHYAAGGVGGSITGSVGDMVSAGGPGQGGFNNGTSVINVTGGAGGSSVFGGGAPTTTLAGAAAINGSAASNYGGGGGGGATSNTASTAAGGNGSAGLCIISEYGPSSNIAVATAVSVKTFTASGTYTPNPNLISAVVECIGGGGGAGGAPSTASFAGSGGAGSGGYSRKILTAGQVGATQTITIGAAGTGSTGAGTAGGDTSFGSLCIAKGGSGSVAALSTGTLNAGGAGGSISGAVGDIVAAGAPGVAATTSGVSAWFAGGAGGSSALGGGGLAAAVPGSAGSPASNYGGGGGGASSGNNGAAQSGGNGSAGICIITEYIGVVPSGGGNVPTYQTFTSGSGTYTTPTGCRQIEVTLIGGGAGGGGGNGGGVGTLGGNTTFGTFTANGAAANPAYYQSGTPGGASGGNIQNIPGGGGQDGTNPQSATVTGAGGIGGVTIRGGAGFGGNNRAGGNAAANSGAGGGGGGVNAGAVATGGAGGSSGGAVLAYINSPAATYSYAVGTGGTGGGAGAGGSFAGGAGAAGIIIVKENY